MGNVLIIKGANFEANAVAQIPYSEWETVDIDDLDVVESMISSVNTWTNGRCVFLPVQPGETYRIVANNGKNAHYAPLTNNNHANGTTPHWATGVSGRIVITAGEEAIFTVPNDANYVYILLGATDDANKPSSIEIHDL